MGISAEDKQMGVVPEMVKNMPNMAFFQILIFGRIMYKPG
jgi:hypothetical protein